MAGHEFAEKWQDERRRALQDALRAPQRPLTAFCRPSVASELILALYGPLRRSEGVLQGAPSLILPFLSKFMACHRRFPGAILTPHPAPFAFFLVFSCFWCWQVADLIGKIGLNCEEYAVNCEEYAVNCEEYAVLSTG